MRLFRANRLLFSNQAPAKGFTHIDTMASPDLNIEITRLLHGKSGAMVYHMKADDNDNTFSTVIKTLCENDTGCPHILEHLACCGSQKFPVRDPFFNMLKRSVNTFMNAWTSEDFTAYPFSSANLKDYHNLYRVYLDMSMKPVLNELDFRQEGWRYEINPDTKQKEIKGIVFNQMKGSYQNAERQLYMESTRRLYANTPLAYDSGGKPESIVQLSYEQVRNMHRHYYHPSNMSFFYYGDADIKQKLQYLDEQYLSRPEYSNKVDWYRHRTQELFAGIPQNIDKVCHEVESLTAETPNIILNYNMDWLEKVGDVDVTCLNILSYLLLETNQAVFYQEFIESGLADGFGTSGVNINSWVSLAVTLKNAKITGADMLNRVERCLHELCERGVDLTRLQEYIVKTEIDILTPKRSQGISYLMYYGAYMNSRLPLTNLANIRQNLNEAVSRLTNKETLKAIVHKYFLSNFKKVVVRQLPTRNKDVGYQNVEGLGMDEAVILRQQQELKERQQAGDANSADCLPKLSLSNLTDPQLHGFKVVKEGAISGGNNASKQIQVQIDKKDVNFVRFVFSLNANQEQIAKLSPYLDVWRYIVNEVIAVKGMSNKQVSSKLNLCTGAFNVSIEKSSPDQEPNKINIVFYASCLNKTLPQYLQVLAKILREPDFRREDVQNIFRAYKSEKVEELMDRGAMQYCLDYGASFLNQQSSVFNSYWRVTQGLQIADAGQVPQEFYQIHHQLLSNADVTVIQHTQQYVDNLLQKVGIDTAQKLNKVTKSNENQLFAAEATSIAVTHQYDVNFCTQQYQGPAFLSQQHAHIAIFLEILEQDYLHPQIREKGGAYGARALYRESGTIALYSYMDPYSTKTYSVFESSLKEIMGLSLSAERLEEAKIKIIGSLDKPLAAQKRCVEEILKDISIQQREQYRKYILECSWEAALATAKRYVMNQKASRVLFGKEVAQGFKQQALKLPPPSRNENPGSGVTHQTYDSV